MIRQPATHISLVLVGLCALVLVLSGCGADREAAPATGYSPSTASEQSQPRAADFAVLNPYWRIAYAGADAIYAFAEVKNNGRIAAGVVVRLTVYDRAGRVLDTYEHHVGGTSNIPPGESVPIKIGLEADPDETHRLAVRVIRVLVWP